MSKQKNYYWRIAGFYFFYYAFVGLFAPYWSLYLKSIQMNAIEIAILMSIQPVMRMIAPNVWGWLADGGYETVLRRIGRGKGRPVEHPEAAVTAPQGGAGTPRHMIVQIAAALSAICYLGVFATTTFGGMFLVLVLIDRKSVV